MNLGWQQAALTGVAVLFLGFLVFRMWPGGGARRALSADAKAARERARAAKTPRERAEALCDAARLAVTGGARWTAAAGFYLRAMNSDPTFAPAVTQLVASFRKRRPRLLEKMLWRRLAVVPWDAPHRESLHAISTGLAALYERELRDKPRSDAMKKMAKTFEA